MGFLSLLPIVGQLIDRVFPDKAASDRAKSELVRLIQEGEIEHLKAASETISSEGKSEHFIVAAWRPITMLVFLVMVVLLFIGMVVSWWLGYTPPNIIQELTLELFGLIKIGLGGYIIGRSGEKIVKILKEK